MARLVCRVTQLGKGRVERLNYGCYHAVVRGLVLNQFSGSAKGPSEVQHDVHEFSTLRSMKTNARLTQSLSYSMVGEARKTNHYRVKTIEAFKDQNKTPEEVNEKDHGVVRKLRIGENVSRKDKINILLKTLSDTQDTKEAIYGALDAFVAWEQNFPIGQLKNVLITLEKEQQWHRVVQVIKWILSKGQGNTMGTYEQLIRALDMDHRVDEAHEIWVKKIGNDLHSVPWKLSKLMISVYYRNNMMERLVKLFQGFEAFDRKPPEKSIVQKVANACEILGRVEERDRILEKYKMLFTETDATRKLSRRRRNN